MADAEQGMVAFLGVAPDPRLLEQDNPTSRTPSSTGELTISTHEHDRLVAAGSVLTGATLIGGVAWRCTGAGSCSSRAAAPSPRRCSPSWLILARQRIGDGCTSRSTSG